MSTTTTTTATTATLGQASMAVAASCGPTAEAPTVDTSARYGDWRDDLFEHGFAVIKQAVPAERTAYYVERMYGWLEGFGLGFDRHDPATSRAEQLPYHWKGGMYSDYGVQHEDFVWEVRQEPGVVGAFGKLWGTDRLLVSFDGINMTVPEAGRVQTVPWPHIDQSPDRRGLACAQGIVNLARNGPRDGGLVVVSGSHRHIDRFFRTHPDALRDERRATWGPGEWFGFGSDEVAWFAAQPGCEVVKVCADAGDLIVWDSRTIHYNTLPETDQVRAVVYACYGPADGVSEADLATKRALFAARRGTTHWPHTKVYPAGSPKERSGEPLPAARSAPEHDVVETPEVLRLAGVLPYV